MYDLAWSDPDARQPSRGWPRAVDADVSAEVRAESAWSSVRMTLRDPEASCHAAPTMRTLVTLQLRREVAELRLRFACEHCGAWDPDTDACAEGYPTAPHRLRSLDEDSLEFCKAFEAR